MNSNLAYSLCPSSWKVFRLVKGHFRVCGKVSKHDLCTFYKSGGQIWVFVGEKVRGWSIWTLYKGSKYCTGWWANEWFLDGVPGIICMCRLPKMATVCPLAVFASIFFKVHPHYSLPSNTKQFPKRNNEYFYSECKNQTKCRMWIHSRNYLGCTAIQMNF